MSDDSSQEKTEQPTQKKLDDARKDGQTVKSKELTSFFSLIAIFTYFIFMQNDIVADFHLIYDTIFTKITSSFLYSYSVAEVNILVKALFGFAFKVLIVPVIMAATCSGFIAMVQAGGFVISPKAMEIKFEKFDIVANAKNIFSMQSLKKFIKDMFQLTIMAIVGYYLIASNIENILNSGYYNINIISRVFFKIIAELFLYLLLIYLFFAIVDYIIERMSFMKKMMMSLEEIKKEMKETDGNPQVKGRQREIHQEMLEEESMEMTVKNSTLVVTNPTHFAICILWDPDKLKLPAIVIKAKDESALTVKKLAKKYNVLTIRDVWLARQLYELGQVKKYVPSSLIAPIADIIGKNLHLLPPDIQESFLKSTRKTREEQTDKTAVVAPIIQNILEKGNVAKKPKL